MSPPALTVAAALASAAERLSRAGIEPARREAEWMFLSILQVTRADLYAAPDRPLSPAHARLVRNALDRRCAREPLQHILGETEFYGLPFRTDPRSLIPRPETETLVEAASHRLAGRRRPLVIDVGTGSGVIAVSLASLLPEALFLATDLSFVALTAAADNARLNRMSSRVRLVRADLLSPFPDRPVFDAVLSNPPYIRSGDIAGLQPEVRLHDPRVALDGGPDGYDVYRALIPAARRLLKPGGLLGLEVGDGQAGDVAEMVRATGAFGAIRILPDLASRDRVVLADRQPD